MLVITREVGEVVCIGPDVRVIVRDITGGRVRLDIIAPKNVRVDREEVRDLIISGQARNTTEAMLILNRQAKRRASQRALDG